MQVVESKKKDQGEGPKKLSNDVLGIKLPNGPKPEGKLGQLSLEQKVAKFRQRLNQVGLTAYVSAIDKLQGLPNGVNPHVDISSPGKLLLDSYQKGLAENKPKLSARSEKTLEIVELIVSAEPLEEDKVDLTFSKLKTNSFVEKEEAVRALLAKKSEPLFNRVNLALSLFEEKDSPQTQKMFGDQIGKLAAELETALTEKDGVALKKIIESATSTPKYNLKLPKK